VDLKEFTVGDEIPPPKRVLSIRSHLTAQGCDAYVIGEIVPGNRIVTYHGALRW
jgi:hypothetical protein